MTPNKNEREWWNNPNTPLWLLPPHCISVEGRTRDGLVFVGQAHRLGDLIAEAEKREREKVLGEVREIVNRAHVKADAKEPKERVDLAVRILTRLRDEILDSLDKME